MTNSLSSVNLTKLPPALDNLWLSFNHLVTVNLSAFPPSLKHICLDHNHLIFVNLSEMPASVEFIDLGMNYLDEAHFNVIMIGGRNTMVSGQDKQRS